jgi:hypothetical protein
MERRRTLAITDGLLVIGALSVIGLLAVTIPLEDPPAIVGSIPSVRITSPVTSTLPLTPYVRSGKHRAPVSSSLDPLDPLKPLPPSPSGEFENGDDRGGQGDARIDLQEAAAMARRSPWGRPWRGETRTDLWINAPASIGSTSPPDPSPGTPSLTD